MKNRNYFFNKKIFFAFAIIFFAAAAIFIFWQKYEAPKNLEIVFLDVGQGDANLIKTPFGQNILIDGGPDNSLVEKLAQELPWWDRQIDLIILTHPHNDHVVGLNEALRRYQVKKILYTGVIHDAPDYLAWLNLIKKNNIFLSIIDRPQTIHLGEDCQLNIIYPRQSFVGRTVDNLNNTSIVTKLECLNAKVIFMGDAETEEEKELLSLNVDLSAQVIKAGHHGSNTSSHKEFLEAIRPLIVIISVGEDNDFSHPSLRTVNRFKRLGAEVYRTDEIGDIRAFFDGAIWKIGN